MNRRAILSIIRKDLKVVAQSKAVVLPLILVPAILFVVLPALAAFIPSLAKLPGSNMPRLDVLLSGAPPGLAAALSGYNETQKYAVWMLVYLMAPMFLILPVMVASVIAADSFAGEKERKTLEALLYTPTSDVDLFVAKTLSAWVPAWLVTGLGFVVYSLVADLTAWNLVGKLILPNLTWTVMVIWVAPAAAGLGLGTMVLVSSRVRTFQEAYQLGGIVVLPIVLLVVGQATGVMYFDVGLVALVGLVLWAIDVALLWLGVRLFRRDELIAQL
jgi:ABC-type transport system involved in multi-copper enzyme maturation permease subunit